MNGLRLLSDVTGGATLSSDSPLDFHDVIYHSLLLIFTNLKDLCIG